MESFCFKEFNVRQSSSAMKVNTDGVLLGAWLMLPSYFTEPLLRENVKVLDIGTGTGVIALIIAQRLSKLHTAPSFFIEAIDIDKPSVDEANYNFSQSPWAEHLIANEMSLQDMEKAQNTEKYDLIVSNPPYFIDSLKSPSARRSSARHNHDLPYEVIIEAATKMLKSDGRLAVVLPADEGEKFISLTKAELVTTLHLARRCRVKTLAGKKEKRYLLEFVKSEEQKISAEQHNTAAETYPTPVEEALIMQETGGLEYTEQYKNFTREFYLKF